jgi:hypothetical protein
MKRGKYVFIAPFSCHPGDTSSLATFALTFTCSCYLLLLAAPIASRHWLFSLAPYSACSECCRCGAVCTLCSFSEKWHSGMCLRGTVFRWSFSLINALCQVYCHHFATLDKAVMVYIHPCTDNRCQNRTQYYCNFNVCNLFCYSYPFSSDNVIKLHADDEPSVWKEQIERKLREIHRSVCCLRFRGYCSHWIITNWCC